MTWRPPAIIFPDIEQVLSDRLGDGLRARPEPHAENVFVGIKLPNPRPRRAVTIRRDGGPTTATRDQPRVGFNVWAPTEKEATALAALVVALVRDLPDGSPVLAVPYVSGPSPVADKSETPQRYFTAEIHTRGTPL